MTLSIVPQDRIDPEALGALASYWTSKLAQGATDTAVGESLLAIGGAPSIPTPDETTEPFKTTCAFALTTGFCAGVDAGLRLAAAIISSPLGNQDADVRAIADNATQEFTNLWRSLSADLAIDRKNAA